MLRIALPDLISPSYFPVIAAVELGYFHEVGLDAELSLRFPVDDAALALRDGAFDLLAGAAHAPLHAFPEWEGVSLLMALSQNMYWFLVVRAELAKDVGDVSDLRDIRIGAAPGPDSGLLRLFEEHGVDVSEARIQIGPVPSSDPTQISFGVAAAEALHHGLVDAFWANGMGAELATRAGTGRVIVDARRDPGMGAQFTFPALAVTDEFLASRRPDAQRAVTAVTKAQRELRANPALAASAAARLFPPTERGLISGLIARDAPFYTPEISDEAVAGLNEFTIKSGLLSHPVSRQTVVAEGLASNP